MNKRELKLDKYGITGKRYKELCGFCEQYPEWKLEVETHTDTLKSKQIDDMPLNPLGGNSDQTGNLAVRRVMMKEKIDLIENTAKEASPDLWSYIIKSVCYEMPFWYVQDIMQIPCSKSSFFDQRRYFFFLLDKRK